jgi:hypothetical protein
VVARTPPPPSLGAGIKPGQPDPANVADYLLVFPEADSRLPDKWVHSTRPTAPSQRPDDERTLRPLVVGCPSSSPRSHRRIQDGC